MKLFSYHYNKSTSVGGVENLIRQLQAISYENNFSCIEMYTKEPDVESYKANTDVRYYKSFGCFINIRVIKRLVEKFNCFFSINFLINLSGGVIFIFHPEDLLLYSNYTLKRNRVILVQTNSFENLFRRFGLFALTKKLIYIDYITVYSVFDRNVLLKHFPSEKDKIKIIPRACRLKTSTSTQEAGMNLVTIARLQESQKNFTSMVEVMKLLPSSYTLDIYGYGSIDEENALKDIISNNVNIRFKGSLTNPTLALNEANIFIMTSHYEGYGQTLIEARSQGLPLVVFNTFDALPSILKNGVNGYIIDYLDHQSFANKIKTICESSDKYKEFSRNSLNMAINTESNEIEKKWLLLIKGLQ